MRSAVRSKPAGAVDDEAGDRRNPRPFVLQALGWSNRDAVGFAIAVLTCVAILINVLWFQSGPHPAPMLKSGLLPQPSAKHATVGALPGPRAAAPAAASAAGKPAPGKTDAAPAAPAARTSADIVGDIQRELARRGFYDDAVDGRYGAKTDAAIRNFERAAGLKPSAEPNEALLRAILARANAKPIRPATGAGQPAAGAAQPAAATPHPPASAPRPAVGLPQSLRLPAPIPSPARAPTPPAPIPAPARTDQTEDAIAPKRVVAVQRALTDYGYGQIKPTGVIDAQTQAAIQKFERERRLPVTGQPSDRVARELAAITGRALD